MTKESEAPNQRNYEAYRSHAEIFNSLGSLMDALHTYENPSRQVSIYELPVRVESYVELPQFLRDYTSVQDWQFLTLDFVHEAGEDEPMMSQAGIEMPTKNPGESLRFGAAEVKGIDMPLEHPVFHLSTRAESDPTQVGWCRSEDINRILLDSTCLPSELTTSEQYDMDILGPEHAAGLEGLVAKYGIRKLHTTSYEIESQLYIDYDYIDSSEDTDSPSGAYLNLIGTPFSVEISNTTDLSLRVYNDSIPVFQPEESLIKELVAAIEDSTEIIKGGQEIEILVKPKTLEDSDTTELHSEWRESRPTKLSIELDEDGFDPTDAS